MSRFREKKKKIESDKKKTFRSDYTGESPERYKEKDFLQRLEQSAEIVVEETLIMGEDEK